MKLELDYNQPEGRWYARVAGSVRDFEESATDPRNALNQLLKELRRNDLFVDSGPLDVERLRTIDTADAQQIIDRLSEQIRAFSDMTSGDGMQSIHAGWQQMLTTLADKLQV